MNERRAKRQLNFRRPRVDIAFWLTCQRGCTSRIASGLLSRQLENPARLIFSNQGDILGFTRLEFHFG